MKLRKTHVMNCEFMSSDGSTFVTAEPARVTNTLALQRQRKDQVEMVSMGMGPVSKMLQSRRSQWAISRQAC